MKRQNCIICSTSKGSRVCKINNNLLICPICCAKTRNPDCEDCIYYSQAEKYTKEKSFKHKSKPFIMEIDTEVNEQVDQALVMAERGKRREAEAIISKLLVTHPHIDMVQYGMGVICLMKNDYNNAIPYFNKAIQINPYFAEAWFNKAASHQKRLELREAIEAHQKVVELGDPTEQFVKHAKDIIQNFEKSLKRTSGLSLDDYFKSMDIFNEAYAAMEHKEWEKAIAGFRRVLTYDPRHVQSHGNIGICYGILGQKAEALKALDQALELDPNYEPAKVNRIAVVSLEEGEKLTDKNFDVLDIEYYKAYSMKKKSLMNKIFG